MPRPSITAFFPCYNDAGTIATIVITADRTLRDLTDDYEIIVGNDASTDNSAEILDELQAIYPRLRVLHQTSNRGYGGILRVMFAAATKDLIFYTDGDAQYDPSELSLLYAQLMPEIDVVQGWKIARSDPLHRKIIGRVYHHIVKLMFGLMVRDVDCDFRMMRRSIFDRVRLEKNSGVICLEMMKKIQDARFTIVEAPVHHYHRAYGRSQFFNFGRIFRTGVDVLKLWYILVIRPPRPMAAPVTDERTVR